MTIVKGELKKIFKNRIIFISLAVFILLNIINIYRNYNIANNSKDENYSSATVYLQRCLDGKITEKKINLINDKIEEISNLAQREYNGEKTDTSNLLTGAAFDDLNLWTKYSEYINKARDYPEMLNDKLLQAKENTGYFKDINTYYTKENSLYYNTYKNRQISEVYDTDSFNDYFTYSFSSILGVIMLMLGVIPMFCSECENDMDVIINTSKYGRRKTIRAKIVTSLIYTVIITLLFEISDLLCFVVFDKLDGFNQYLYGVTGYEFTPTEYRVWEFALILFVMRLIGMCIISMLFLLTSRLFTKSIAPFGLSVTIFISLMLCKGFYTNQTGKIINIFNPISMLTSHTYYSEFMINNIFGEPIFTYKIIPFVGIAAIIILSFIILLLPLKVEVKVPKIRFRKGISL